MRGKKWLGLETQNEQSQFIVGRKCVGQMCQLQ